MLPVIPQGAASDYPTSVFLTAGVSKGSCAESRLSTDE